MADFQRGEIVNVTITGARYSGPGLETHTHQVFVGDATYEMPPSAVLERVAPQEWPPQPRDVWVDEPGREWFAYNLTYDGYTALELLSQDGSRAHPDAVLELYGPLTLVHRPGWIPGGRQ